MSEPEQQAIIDPPRAIRVKTSTGWSDLAIKGADGVGVPPGGSTGQLLTKTSPSDYATAWVPAPVALPPGGAIGQSLTKKTAADGDAQWTTLDNLHYLGDYAAGSFVEGDVVVYNGVAYVCTAPTSSPPSAWPGAPPVVQPPATVTGYGTTLPASPYDGQEYVLVDSLTAATYQWRFRYNAGRTADGYKWEYVGGTPGEVGDSSDWAIPVGWAVVPGPSFTVPRGGVYVVQTWLDWTQTGGTAVVLWQSGGSVGGAYTGASHMVPASANDGVFPSRSVVSLSAGDVQRFWTYGGAAGVTAKRRVMTVVPKRVS